MRQSVEIQGPDGPFVLNLDALGVEWLGLKKRFFRLPDGQTFKQCNRCETWKPASGFSRDAKSAGGVGPYCRKCDAQRRRDWHAANRERSAEASHAYYLENRERISKQARSRYLASPERALERARTWKAVNPEKRRAANRRREALKLAVTIGAFTASDVAARMEARGNKCWVCSGPFEHVDHFKPLAKGGAHALSNLRPACGSCNSAKSGRWYGVAEMLEWAASRRHRVNASQEAA